MSATALAGARRWRRASLLLLASLLALAVPRGIAAQLPGDVAFLDPNGDLGYLRNNVPDIDQRRGPGDGILGLPPRVKIHDDFTVTETPGGMYCVPTSAFNWLAYIANHGYPDVLPGPGAWEVSPPEPNYNLATLNILNLGLLMGTDPQNGTKGKPAASTIAAFLNSAAPGHFMVMRWNAKGSSAPRFHNLANLAVSGALVMPSVGWYQGWDVPGSPKILIRSGGHVFCLAYANRNHFGGGRQIGIRDPASDEGDVPGRFTMQAPFMTDIYSVQDVESIFVEGGSLITRTQTRVLDYGSASLDGATWIIPTYGLVAQPGGTIVLLSPVHLLGWEKPLANALPAPGEVLQLAVDPASTEHPFLVQGSRAVWTLDVLTGQSRQLIPRLPQEASDLVLGTPNRNLYLLLPGNRILCVPPQEEAERLAELPQPVNARLPVDAMTWDESRQRLVVVSAENQQLRFFDSDLNHVETFSLPPGVLPRDHRRRNNGDRRISLSVGENGDLFTHRDGDRRATRLTVEPDGRGERRLRTAEVPVPGGVGDPVDLHVDELGRLYVTDALTGLLQVFNGNGEELRDVPFAGLPGGRGLRILRTFDNFDPEIHETDEWRNVLPDEAVR